MKMSDSDWKTNRLPLWTGLAAAALVIAVLGGGFLWWRSKAARLNPGNAPRIGYLETNGPSRRRHSHTIAWDDIEDHSALFLRDLIFTPMEVTSVVVLDDQRRLPLPSGSMVELDEQTTESLKIQLIEPEKMMASALPSLDGLFWFADPTVWEWRQSELTDRGARFQSGGVKLASLIPMNRVSRTPLQPLVTDFEIKILSARPLSLARTVRFQWSPVPVDGVRYELQMASDKDFLRMSPRAVPGTSINLPLTKAGTYYWRVVAIAANESVVSAISAVTLREGGRIIAFDPGLNVVRTVSGGIIEGIGKDAAIKGQGHQLATRKLENLKQKESGLTKSEIDPVVKRRIGELRACSERRGPTGEGFQGKVFLNFKILPNGTTDQITLDSSSPTTEFLNNCVARSVRRWHFPKPRAGRTVPVSYPFVFATIED